MSKKWFNSLVELYTEGVKRKTLVYFDPDVDGLFAGYLGVDFLKKHGISPASYVNKNRVHGFDMRLLPQLKDFFIVAVDFAVTREEVEQIVNNGTKILVLDHHAVEDELIISKRGDEIWGLVINNQYVFEPEEDRYLSGAGVVYETLCMLDDSFKSKEKEALVGITLLSDGRELENKKAKKYLRSTYTVDPKSEYIQHLIQGTLKSDFGFGCPRLDRNFVDFTLSPVINSLLRFGLENEAMDFVLGKRLKSTEVRGRQQELLAYLQKECTILALNNLKVVAVFPSRYPELRKGGKFADVEVTNFIGLLASRIKGNDISVLAFVLNRGTVTRCSFRGRYSDLNYRLLFTQLGYDAEGHPPAFGIIHPDFSFDVGSSKWQELDDAIGELETNHDSSIKVYETANLAYFIDRNGSSLADNNIYVRDMYRKYIRYTGSNVKVLRETEKSIRYLIDGREVLCFDKSINTKNGLILPMLSRGYLSLYLVDGTGLIEISN